MLSWFEIWPRKSYINLFNYQLNDGIEKRWIKKTLLRINIKSKVLYNSWKKQEQLETKNLIINEENHNFRKIPKTIK